MHYRFNGLPWHTNHALLVTAGFVTACLLFHEGGKEYWLHVAKQYSSHLYPVKEATTATHTLGLNFTLKL